MCFWSVLLAICLLCVLLSSSCLSFALSLKEFRLPKYDHSSDECFNFVCFAYRTQYQRYEWIYCIHTHTSCVDCWFALCSLCVRCMGSRAKQMKYMKWSQLICREISFIFHKNRCLNWINVESTHTHNNKNHHRIEPHMHRIDTQLNTRAAARTIKCANNGKWSGR